MRYLALCCIAKDEGPFIKEWALYHSCIGVEHLFIYDNGSTPTVAESLGDLARSPHITIINTPSRAMQLPAYNHCLTEFGNDFAWIGFIDVDEFLCFSAGQDIRPLLAEYEPYGGLALNWRMFSSNAHENRPEGLVIDNYTRYILEGGTQIKSMVQPRKTSGCRNAHAFGYLNGFYCVNESREPLPAGAAFWFSSHERMWVNHYYYRSREDFSLKLQRGRGHIQRPSATMERFAAHLEKESFSDKTITRFSARVRAAMLEDGPFLPFMPPAEAGLAELFALSSEKLIAGKLEEALICLCHAAMGRAESPDIWMMRATLARMTHAHDSAAHFLRQAARLGESLQLYAGLAELALAAGNTQKAADAVSLLRIAMSRSGTTGGQWGETLERLEKRLE